MKRAGVYHAVSQFSSQEYEPKSDDCHDEQFPTVKQAEEIIRAVGTLARYLVCRGYVDLILFPNSKDECRLDMKTLFSTGPCPHQRGPDTRWIEQTVIPRLVELCKHDIAVAERKHEKQKKRKTTKSAKTREPQKKRKARPTRSSRNTSVDYSEDVLVSAAVAAAAATASDTSDAGKSSDESNAEPKTRRRRKPMLPSIGSLLSNNTPVVVLEATAPGPREHPDAFRQAMDLWNGDDTPDKIVSELADEDEDDKEERDPMYSWVPPCYAPHVRVSDSVDAIPASDAERYGRTVRVVWAGGHDANVSSFRTLKDLFSFQDPDPVSVFVGGLEFETDGVDVGSSAPVSAAAAAAAAAIPEEPYKQHWIVLFHTPPRVTTEREIKRYNTKTQKVEVWDVSSLQRSVLHAIITPPYDVALMGGREWSVISDAIIPRPIITTHKKHAGAIHMMEGDTVFAYTTHDIEDDGKAGGSGVSRTKAKTKMRRYVYEMAYGAKRRSVSSATAAHSADAVTDADTLPYILPWVDSEDPVVRALGLGPGTILRIPMHGCGLLLAPHWAAVTSGVRLREDGTRVAASKV
jgi:hypothetical protein